MDKYYILKQLLCLKYDMIRMDIKVLDVTIKLVCNIEDVTNKKGICDVLEYAKNKVINQNIKEALEIMTSNLYLYEYNNIDKILINLYCIKKYLIKSGEVYKKYTNLIERK